MSIDDPEFDIKRRLTEVKVQLNKIFSINAETQGNTRMYNNLMILDLKLQILELAIEAHAPKPKPVKKNNANEIPPPPQTEKRESNPHWGPKPPSGWGKGKGPLKLSFCLKKE